MKDILLNMISFCEYAFILLNEFKNTSQPFTVVAEEEAAAKLTVGNMQNADCMSST